MRNFIKGFLSCVVLLESIFTFVIWKWVKGENICGWKIEAKRMKYAMKSKIDLPDTHKLVG